TICIGLNTISTTVNIAGISVVLETAGTNTPTNTPTDTKTPTATSTPTATATSTSSSTATPTGVWFVRSGTLNSGCTPLSVATLSMTIQSGGCVVLLVDSVFDP